MSERFEPGAPGALLWIYGSGGHREQARRLRERWLVTGKGTLTWIALREDPASDSWIDATYEVGALREKYARVGDLGQILARSWKILKTTREIDRKFEVRVVISLGPGIAILPSLYYRFKGVRVIHIETWSRFYRRSWTGMAMRWIANRMYIQNASLAPLYPRALDRGRL